MDCLDYTTHLDVDTIMYINSNCNLLLTQRKNKHTNKLTLLCWNWSTKPKYWRILCHSDISIEFKWAWIELHWAAISYFRVLFLLSFQVFNPITQTRYVHLQKYNNGLWCCSTFCSAISLQSVRYPFPSFRWPPEWNNCSTVSWTKEAHLYNWMECKIKVVAVVGTTVRTTHEYVR